MSTMLEIQFDEFPELLRMSLDEGVWNYAMRTLIPEMFRKSPIVKAVKFTETEIKGSVYFGYLVQQQDKTLLFFSLPKRPNNVFRVFVRGGKINQVLRMSFKLWVKETLLNALTNPRSYTDTAEMLAVTDEVLDAYEEDKIATQQMVRQLLEDD